MNLLQMIMKKHRSMCTELVKRLSRLMELNISKREKERLDYLKCWDILIITVIMFGFFIWSSLLSFYDSSSMNVTQLSDFTSGINWNSIAMELGLLSITFLYLYFRRFHFSQWKIKINLKSILKGVVLFLGVALIFDLYFMLIYSIFPYPNIDNSIFYDSQTTNSFFVRLYSIDLSLVFFSILNGFYEEIFFLGICLSIEPDKRVYYFIYSLLIRYSFHTYQGNMSAIAIGLLLGGIYYFLYTSSKEKNLFPFFLSHAIADMFGLGIISYFF